MPDRSKKALHKRMMKIGMESREAQNAIESIIDSIAAGLEKDKEVKISGFGTFEVRKRNVRNARMPGKAAHIVPARQAVHFKPSPHIFSPSKTKI